MRNLSEGDFDAEDETEIKEVEMSVWNEVATDTKDRWLVRAQNAVRAWTILRVERRKDRLTKVAIDRLSDREKTDLGLGFETLRKW